MVTTEGLRSRCLLHWGSAFCPQRSRRFVFRFCMAEGTEIPAFHASKGWDVARPHAHALPGGSKPHVLFDRLSLSEGRIHLVCRNVLGRDGIALRNPSPSDRFTSTCRYRACS